MRLKDEKPSKNMEDRTGWKNGGRFDFYHRQKRTEGMDDSWTKTKKFEKKEYKK